MKIRTLEQIENKISKKLSGYTLEELSKRHDVGSAVIERIKNDALEQFKKQAMNFETEYTLEQFRKVQKDYFDESGKSYKSSFNNSDMPDKMLRIINQLEKEILAKVVVKKDGSQFTAPDNIVWEYEADDDYLTTVSLK